MITVICPRELQMGKYSREVVDITPWNKMVKLGAGTKVCIA